MKNAILFLLTAVFLTSVAQAYAPKVGRAAAARYFEREKRSGRGMAAVSSETIDESSAPAPRSSPSYSSSTSYSPPSNLDDHYMAFGFGTFSEGTSYNWGQNGREEKVGNWGADITYRMAEQEYLFDEALRISYAQYKPVLLEATKLSFMYSITFPEAGSRFPLYFGAAGGLGIFMKQLPGESPISFDYQLFLGARVFNIFDSVGLYIEGGLRNHLNITADGQFNGTFLSLGTVFTF